MDMDKILAEHSKGVSYLTIQTDSNNQFDLENFEEFDKKLGIEAQNPLIRVLVLRSGTMGVFSQGLNLTWLAANENSSSLDRYLQLFYSILHKIYFSHVPVIAEINGHAMGYGAMLALAADYRFMVESGARIGLPEIKLGIGVPLFICKLLENTVGYEKTFKHVIDGSPWKSVAAHEIGLIDEIHTSENLATAVQKLASRIAASPHQAVKAIKKAMRYSMTQTAKEMLQIDIAETYAIIKTADAREGISAAVAGRRPRFAIP
jgi:enoyl-CoA hydratase/carnithine racemase